MVSKFRALIAVITTAVVTAYIADRIKAHQVNLLAARQRVANDEAWRSGWDAAWNDATNNPIVVTEAYKKLYLKHQ